MFFRTSSTTRTGSNFSQPTLRKVWAKGYTVPGHNPQFCRRDRYGALMEWNNYGNTNAHTGWEVDHIIPVSKGGGDDLSNLQPLQWANNRRKGDNAA